MYRLPILLMLASFIGLSQGYVRAQTGPDGVTWEDLRGVVRGDGYDSYLFEKDGKSYILEYDHASDTAWWTILEYVDGAGNGFGSPTLEDTIDLMVLLEKMRGGRMEAPHKTPFDQWVQHSELGIDPLHNPVIATPVDGFEGNSGLGLGMPGMSVQETLRRWAGGSGNKDDNGDDSPGPHDGPANARDIGLPGPADLVNPVLNTVPFASGFASIARHAF